MKIIVVQTNSFAAKIQELQAKFIIDRYIFIGRNALTEYQLKKSLSPKIERINFAKLFSSIQYKYLDDYYDFIDNTEKDIGGREWWSSWLSWKNPWISFFYLRFCQVKVLENIIEQEKEVENSTILVIVEESVILESIRKTFTTQQGIDIDFYYKKDRWQPKTWVKGFIRRLFALPKYLLDNVKFNRTISKHRIFKFKKDTSNSFIFLPTFVEARSFRSGKYKDPFLGKLLTNFQFEDEEVIIVPIILNANKTQLELFNTWLIERNFEVVQLSQLTSIFNIGITALKNCFKFPTRTTSANLLNIEVSTLINQERLDEWATYSMQYHFLNILAKKIKNLPSKKLLIYPYENQAWERVLLSGVEHNKIVTFGLQNAPCPLLSTRFYFSKKQVQHLPLPKHMLVNGDISHLNLSKYYQHYSKVVKSSTSRPITLESQKSIDDNRVLSIMVGCSLGLQESIELVIFITEALRDSSKSIINIVKHPIVNYDYQQLLKDIAAPNHIKMSTIGFNEELKRADLMFFDSSTVGLQAMLHGIQPVFIGHETVLHVNPNEYDRSITKMIYSQKELKDFVESYELENYDTSRGVTISKEYFGDGSGIVSEQYIYDIWTAFKQEG